MPLILETAAFPNALQTILWYMRAKTANDTFFIPPHAYHVDSRYVLLLCPCLEIPEVRDPGASGDPTFLLRPSRSSERLVQTRCLE